MSQISSDEGVYRQRLWRAEYSPHIFAKTIRSGCEGSPDMALTTAINAHTITAHSFYQQTGHEEDSKPRVIPIQENGR